MTAPAADDPASEVVFWPRSVFTHTKLNFWEHFEFDLALAQAIYHFLDAS